MTTPRRRWYTFSLRAMLLIVVVVAVLFGWLERELQRTRQQRIVVAALEKLSCQISIEDVSQNSQTRLLKVFGVNWYKTVTAVSTRAATINDADMPTFRRLTELRYLNLYNQPITDAGLRYLQGLTNLDDLCLGSTKITDAGLENLRGLKQLERLVLYDTHVTDAGLVNLQGLTQLNMLRLDNTQVTDAGLVHLSGLRRLRQLCLLDTQVTDEGVAELKKALPKTRVSWGQRFDARTAP